jgi:hypothetical protein
VIGSEEALDETLTIQLGDEKLRITTYTAKMMVTRCFGRRYTASRYTFSPPDRGNMVPNSSQIKSPQSERTKPMTQSISDAPTDPTKPRMDDGVENIPVPMMAPMLVANVRKSERYNRRVGHLSNVQLKTPRWRPIPPAVSSGYMSEKCP